MINGGSRKQSSRQTKRGRERNIMKILNTYIKSNKKLVLDITTAVGILCFITRPTTVLFSVNEAIR